MCGRVDAKRPSSPTTDCNVARPAQPCRAEMLIARAQTTHRGRMMLETHPRAFVPNSHLLPSRHHRPPPRRLEHHQQESNHPDKDKTDPNNDVIIADDLRNSTSLHPIEMPHHHKLDKCHRISHLPNRGHWQKLKCCPHYTNLREVHPHQL